MGGSLAGANPLSLATFQSMGGSLLDGDASGAGTLRLESCVMGMSDLILSAYLL